MSALAAAAGGCGHTLRAGAGPLVDSDGRGGIEVSGEIGTHLVSSRLVGMPVGVRTELSVLSDGTVQGLIGFVSGVHMPPGGRGHRATDGPVVLEGWGGRLSTATGAAIGDGKPGFAVRGGLALTRGQIPAATSTAAGAPAAARPRSVTRRAGGRRPRSAASWPAPSSSKPTR
ncbi:MAG TPA: hypothetical protein VM734_30010 [Kofleriaceae bacterium]|nr:hypothetical protein [Kofleriaceae bacterium]